MSTLNYKLEGLKLHPDIKNKAEEIYRSLPYNLKTKKNVALITYLVVSEAYKALGEVFNRAKLEQALGVKKTNNILKSAARLGYELILYHYKPQDFLLPSKDPEASNFLGKIGIKVVHYPEISDMIDKFLDLIQVIMKRILGMLQPELSFTMQ